MKSKRPITGYAYHIQEDFFKLIDDPAFMENKGGRPAYYCVRDKETGLLWMVPLSSKIEKYKKIYDKQMQKYGECLKVVIAKFGNAESAFVLQNMFPITDNFISYIHKDGEKAVRLNKKYQQEIQKKMSKLKLLYDKGIKFVYTDIKKIEEIMLNNKKICIPPQFIDNVYKFSDDKAHLVMPGEKHSSRIYTYIKTDDTMVAGFKDIHGQTRVVKGELYDCFFAKKTYAKDGNKIKVNYFAVGETAEKSSFLGAFQYDEKSKGIER